jgi:hypothetical protein
MKTVTLLFVFTVLDCRPTYAQTGPDKIRLAATRAVAIVQRSAIAFYKSQVCFSCHSHVLPLLTFQMAREHGIAVDEDACL